MMNGQLDLHGFVENWENINKILSGSSAAAAGSESTGEDQWTNDWNWESEYQDSVDNKNVGSGAEKSTSTSSSNFIQSCIIANSPVGDVLVLAKSSKAIFFFGDWDEAKKAKFTKTYEGQLAQEPGESIQSVLCLPLISKKKSSIAQDWTCIVVGFSSGYIRFYTEDGSLLMNQMFHNESVKEIKCRSFQAATNSTDHDSLEELVILYESVIVSVDGFSLFQTLRACRNQLARIQANISETTIDNPVLTYKKWKFDNIGHFKDAESIGLRTSSTFDQLVSASIVSGINAKTKLVPYTSNIFIATGPKNYLSFNFASESHSNEFYGQIAYAVANKLKSSILNAASGWLPWTSSSKQTQSNVPNKDKVGQIESSIEALSRFELRDSQREGKQICLSPCRKLTAVVDSLGRVILIDNNLGIAVRVWKGYRGGECAWLSVEEKISSRSKSGQGRKALFLLIHSPKRGLIEAFSMHQGPKVASFTVGKNGRLIRSNYGMLGLNNVPILGGNIPPFQCLFIDNEGQLFSFNIPFHLALCDKTNTKVKDIHRLKTLQKKLRDDNDGDNSPAILLQDISEILAEIKNQSMVNQAFKILTQKCKSIQILSEITQEYITKNVDQEEKDLNSIFRIQSICELYTFLTNSASKPPSYLPAEEDLLISDPHSILKCLHMTDREIKSLETMACKELDKEKNTKSKSVSFKKDQDMISLNEFFSSFLIDFDPNKPTANKEGKISINRNSDSLNNLTSLLFCGIFNGSSDLDEWSNYLKNASLVPCEMLYLIMQYWLENALKSSSYILQMERFYKVIRALCELEGFDKVISEFGNISSWWEKIRREIVKNSQLFYIFSFSLVCRAVEIDVENEFERKNREAGKEKQEQQQQQRSNENVETCENAGPETSSTNTNTEPDASASATKEMEKSMDECDWENISYDSIRWNILIKQIEDLYILSTIIQQKPKIEASNRNFPLLPNEIKELSTMDLLIKGKGCIAELIGKWLTSIGINPEFISDLSEIELPSAPQGSPKSKRKKKTKDELLELAKSESDSAVYGVDSMKQDSGTLLTLELIDSLKENFSVSLNPSIILANYGWEYCLEWNKDVNQVEYLQAALKCIEGISSSFLKHGMMIMMWNTFILRKFSILSSKSKENRDQYLDKFSGFIQPEKKNTFLGLCVTFLDHLMEINVKCESEGGPSTSKAGNNQKTHWSSSDASASLTDLAISQPLSNYEMILLHYQLALCTHFVYTFNIKRPKMKPINFFDTKSGMLFFQGLHINAPYSNVEVDLALKSLREEFLCLIISGAIHTIPEDLSADSSENTMIIPSNCGIVECESWIQKCFEIARIWGLDLNGLRINQICEFYSSGLDNLGLEAIGSVSEKRDILGSKLLVVVGMRMNYIVRQRTGNVPEVLASLSTNLTNWIYNLNYSRLRSLRFSKESIQEVAHQILQLIPDSNYDYKLVEEIHSISTLLI